MIKNTSTEFKTVRYSHVSHHKKKIKISCYAFKLLFLKKARPLAVTVSLKKNKCITA